MIKRFIYTVILFIFNSLLFILCYSFSASAQTKSNSCFMCHSAKSLRKISQENVRKLLYINEDEYESSVHGKRPCIDCHSDIKDDPHPKSLKKVDCTKCHNKENIVGAPRFSPYDIYQDSVHGKALKKGVKDVPLCKDCHGEHNIKKKTNKDSLTYHSNIPKTCAKCHSDMKIVKKYHIHKEKAFEEYETSVHGKGLYKYGLSSFAAVCTDCHGVHNIKGGDDAEYIKRPETCGRCHIGILETYLTSVHGELYKKGNNDVPVCVDCHGEHRILAPGDSGSPVSVAQVADTCSKCHNEERITKKYKVLLNKVFTYQKSYHGIASKFGNTFAANCASCHGYHNILPSSDPNSSINKRNLPKTCGKCHPGAGKHFAEGKVHIDVTKKESGILYNLHLVFRWIIIITAGIVAFWILLDLIRRLRKS